MLRFRGVSALSAFRQEKLAAAINIFCSQVSHIYAEHWYFCTVSRDLKPEETRILENLLGCSRREAPEGGAAEKEAGRQDDELLLVLPRPGTISPWSTKATDIVHHCGLSPVKRL